MQRTVIFGMAAAVLAVLGYLSGYYTALGERSATQTVTQTLTQTATASERCNAGALGSPARLL
jgi:hypothetical protein